MQVTALLPLFLDALATDHGLPAERCLDDCVVLAHAYAQLGIAAEVRAAELVITTATGQSSTHGSLNPRWQRGLMHGHAVVWLPGLAHLADVTAGQYPEIEAAGHGPVIAACTLLPGSDAAGDVVQVDVPWDGLQLAYTLAPLATTALMLDHPVMRADEDGHRRRGLNVASAAVRLLADFLPPEQARLIRTRGQPPWPRPSGTCPITARLQATCGSCSPARTATQSRPGWMRFPFRTGRRPPPMVIDLQELQVLDRRAGLAGRAELR